MKRGGYFREAVEDAIGEGARACFPSEIWNRTGLKDTYAVNMI